MDGLALIAVGIIVLSIGVALAAGFHPARATMTTVKDEGSVDGSKQPVEVRARP